MLLLAWPALALGIAAFLYGVSLFAQRVLYEQVADRLPLRALVAGLVVGSVLAGWTALNRQAEFAGKYGTLFEFSASSTRELERFEAVRRTRFKDADGKPREEVVPFRRSGQLMVDPEGREFRVGSSDYMTVALLVPAKTGDGTVRYVAAEENGAFVRSDRHVTYREENGRATVSDENIGLMNVPSFSGLLGAMALNLLHFLAWFLAFWPILRYTLGPAIGFTLVIGAASMFVLVPVLFQTFPKGGAG